MSLELNNVSKRYAKDYIFRNFSYKFDEFCLYLITGNSGIGKTTLLRLISGLDISYEGEIVGGGAKNVSVSFQEYRLFENLSALENVHLENSDDCIRARNLLLSLGLTEEETLKPARDLSGGMKQRVSIARAIFKNSPILCLDEPTKEIGKENVKKLVNVLKEESKKRIVIVITHNEEDFSELDFKKIQL